MNTSPLFALKALVVLALLLLEGCGPDDGLKELAKGEEAYQRGDRAKAAAYFEESIAANPSNVEACVRLALTRLDDGNLNAAEKALSLAEALEPNASDVRLLAAQIAWHRKNYDKAKERFLAVADDVKLDNAVRAEGWTGYGIVAFARNQPHFARIAFLRALRLDRRHASAWYHLGLLYRDSFGYNDAALEQLNIYVRLDTLASPRVQKVQRVMIPALQDTLSAAAAEHASGLTYADAITQAKKTLKRDSSKNGMEKAFDYYKRACVLHPGAVSVFLTTGELAAKIGLHAQAVEIYSRAFAANPASTDALDGLIRALRKVGGKKKEADAYQAYRDLLGRK